MDAGQYVVVQGVVTVVVAWSRKLVRFPNCHKYPVGGRARQQGW